MKQGNSQLGLLAQTEIIEHFVKEEKNKINENYQEVYTGKELSGCTELRKAMEQCKNEGATLIIAKTDRFRNKIKALKIYEKMEGNI